MLESLRWYRSPTEHLNVWQKVRDLCNELQGTGFKISYDIFDSRYVLCDIKNDQKIHTFYDERDLCKVTTSQVERILSDYLQSDDYQEAIYQTYQKLAQFTKEKYGYVFDMDDHRIVLTRGDQKLSFSYDAKKFPKIADIKIEIVKLLRRAA